MNAQATKQQAAEKRHEQFVENYVKEKGELGGLAIELAEAAQELTSWEKGFKEEIANRNESYATRMLKFAQQFETLDNFLEFCVDFEDAWKTAHSTKTVVITRMASKWTVYKSQIKQAWDKGLDPKEFETLANLNAARLAKQKASQQPKVSETSDPEAVKGLQAEATKAAGDSEVLSVLRDMMQVIIAAEQEGMPVEVEDQVMNILKNASNQIKSAVHVAKADERERVAGTPATKAKAKESKAA